jgi:galactokinase
MGSHTDYNEGFVFPMAIDRDTVIAAGSRPDRQVVIHSLNLGQTARFSLDTIARNPEQPWVDYVSGVALFLEREGHRLAGVNAVVHGTVPIGAGLSSSASLEVSAALMFRALNGLKMERLNTARLCQQAENEFVGMNCGILDQFTSLFGAQGCGLLLDCRALTAQPVALNLGDLAVVICDTRVKRELTGSEYGIRRAQCEEGVRRLREFLPGITALRDVSLEQFERHQDALPEVVARRCRFIIEENQRVLDTVAALKRGDLSAVAGLLAASYEGARDLYDVGCAEMEAMIEAMSNAPGCLGGRQADAGFGGCMMALVKREVLAAFATEVAEAYQRITGIAPEIYPVEAAAGAQVVV